MMNRLRAWLASLTAAPQRFGAVLPGKGAITTSAAVACTGSTSVLAFNGNRRVAVMVNTHATITAYLGTATTAIGQGIVLAPGASYVDTDSQGQWFCIPASGTVNIAVTEIT